MNTEVGINEKPTLKEFLIYLGVTYDFSAENWFNDYDLSEFDSALWRDHLNYSRKVYPTMKDFLVRPFRRNCSLIDNYNAYLNDYRLFGHTICEDTRHYLGILIFDFFSTTAPIVMKFGVRRLTEAEKLCPNGLWSGIDSNEHDAYRYRNHCRTPPCSVIAFTGDKQVFCKFFCKFSS